MERRVLVIAEKPDAAKRIAVALDEREAPKRMLEGNVSYYVAKRGGTIVVASAVGHLYTVAAEGKGWNRYPVFSMRWVPRHVAERKAGYVRSWINVIAKLAEDADEFVDACDYDVEGSVIGYCLLKYACGGKEHVAKRMKYSTLTTQELRSSYADLLPRLDFPLVEAGLARHEVDWIYGINLSRALTSAARHHVRRRIALSTGRVQGPVLQFLVARENTIRCFVPTPFWEIRALVQIDGQECWANHEKSPLETKKEAEAILAECRGKSGTVEKIDVKSSPLPPPVPFDLGGLQSEAYRLFRYSPKRTESIAQRLYLDALISYPRTGSQKLPPAIDYAAILHSLSKVPEYSKLAEQLLATSDLRPNEGRKEDPAHPAIYPTGMLPERRLEKHESSLLDLAIRRFMAVFAGPAVQENTCVRIDVGGHGFCLSGTRTLEEGWLRFYRPYARADDVALPPVKEGQTVDVRKVASKEKFTTPPARYNPRSLLKAMETAGIGTKATRGDVIQTLVERKYVRGERMMVTDLGFEVHGVLQEYCPTVASVELTRGLEDEMEAIRRGSAKKDEVVASVIRLLGPVLAKLKENEKAIGERLATHAKLEEETSLGSCPKCGAGKLMIVRSRKTRKRFVGCTEYFRGRCTASFPLPQRGTVKSLGRCCPTCGSPMIQVRVKTWNPWVLCLNPDCPSKKERGPRP